MNSMYRLTLLSASAVLIGGLATTALAQQEEMPDWSDATGYANSAGSGGPVKTVDGCLITSRWTEDMKREPCHEVPAAAPMVEAEMTRAAATFEAQTLFAFDSDALKPEGEDALRDLVREMGQASTITGIEIVGHTDSTGPADYNQKLSERRANTVKAALVNLGINEGLITARGEGEDNPIADNGTRDGRAQNRRVEVTVEGVTETEASS